MIRAFLIACGLLAATTAEAQQVLSNPSFTSWPHGSPVRGSFGSGSETAAHWISKWGKSPASVAVASSAPGGGYRYALRPDPTRNWKTFRGVHNDGADGGETFYLRQHVPHPLPGNYQVTIKLVSHSGGIRGGFYIYQGDHLHLLNRVGSSLLPKNLLRTYSTPYRLPGGSSADLHVAFLFTTPAPAVVDVRSFFMLTVP